VRPDEGWDNRAFSLGVSWYAAAKGDIAMAIDKGGARLALERIEHAINEQLRALAANEPVDRDELAKNFQIRDFLVEAMKY
jgi:hypothetical protein